MREALARSRMLRWLTAFSVSMLGLFAVLIGTVDANTSLPVDIVFVSGSTDDPPGAVDPGYTKDVGECRAELVDGDHISITMTNGYPSYTCTFTVEALNTGMLPVRLESLEFEVPPVLTLRDLTGRTGAIIDPGQRDRETFSVHVEQPASQGAEYTFTIRKVFRQHQTGTIGFWKNWNKHKKFSKAQIEAWLAEIDTSSRWFGPRTVNGMVSAMNAGEGGTPYQRFFAHCLATRLDERAGFLDGLDTHDVTGADPGNYLGLASPSSATLNQIIAAVEVKFGTSPTNAQYLIMKDVCDRLNNLLI